MENQFQIEKENKSNPVNLLAAEIRQHINNFGNAGDLIGLDDEKINALYSIGHYQYTQGKYKEAFKTFQIIVLNDHLNRRAIKALGSCLQMLKFYEDAMKQLAIAVYMEPSDPGPALQIAECMLALNNKKDAMTLLKKIKNEFGPIAEFKEINTKVNGLLELLNA
jgi:type III secretion system low calcium response chaperone LcrH/SycD